MEAIDDPGLGSAEVRSGLAVTEATLLDRLRAGDCDAFEHLVSTYGERLYHVARRLLRDDEEARDALQEAFLQAFRGVSRFAGQAQVSTWLHRIVVNASLMKLRSRRTKPEEPIEDHLPKFDASGHRVDHPCVAWELQGEQLLEQKEVRVLVRASIDRLPASYRTVLLMRDIEELDTQEVAELLGITTNAVKIRLHRARQALRELLDPVLRPQPA